MAHILFVTPYYPPEKGAPQARISETACDRFAKSVGIVQADSSQCLLGSGEPPWFVCHAPHGETGRTNYFPIEVKGCRYRNEREFVRLAIANLEVVRASGFWAKGNIQTYDNIAASKHIVLLWSRAWQKMELPKWDGPVALRAMHAHAAVKSGQRNSDIGGMCRNTSIRPAEYRVNAVYAVASCAP